MRLCTASAALTGLLWGLLPAAALAAAPPPPPGCSARKLTRTNSVDVPIPDNASATSTVTVDAGAGRVIWDVDVRVSITHPSNNQIDLSLIAPDGTVVVLTTDNGLARDNGFDGTRFDDSAPIAIVNATFPDDGAVPHAAPEGALARLQGKNPNGTWTLQIADDLANTTGTLTSWSLELVTLPAAAPTQTASASDTTSTPLPETGTLTFPLEVSAPGDFLTGVTVTTNLRHTFPADLDVTLTSPSGRTIELTTDNGGGSDDVFDGTVWSDAAETPVTDASYSLGVVQPSLQPEGALAAFLGENPNGTWILTVTDDASVGTGSFEGWALNLETATGVACVNGGLTVNGVSPGQGPSGGGTQVTVTGTNFATGASVLFDGLAGSNPEVTPNSATATTPPHAVGRVEVSVRNPDGEYASRAEGFHFVTAAPAPILESLSPNTGSTAGGTALTLQARNLIDGAQLTIGMAQPVAIGIVDESTAVATTPLSSFGTFDVTVTNPDGQSSTVPAAFTYVAPAPKLTDVDPNLGSTLGGTAVALRGDAFLPGVEVLFGGERAEVQLIDEQLIEAIAPAHAAGVVDLVITNPDGQTLTRSRAFTYEVPPEDPEVVDGAGGCGCGAGGASGALLSLLAMAVVGLRARVRQA